MQSVTEQPSDSKFTKDALVQQIETRCLSAMFLLVWGRDRETQIASKNQTQVW